MADIDLAEIRKECLESLYLCAENVGKYLDAEEKEVEFKKLKSYVEDYCRMEAEQDVAEKALEKAEKETDDSNLDTLQERFEAYMTSMAEKKLDVNKHKDMIKITKIIERGMKTTNNLDESDLVESQSRPICPITKRPIENPVKNSICGHIYDKDAIMKIINMKNRSKCPVSGCPNGQPVTPGHLVTDEELEFRMTAPVSHSTMIQNSVMDLDDD